MKTAAGGAVMFTDGPLSRRKEHVRRRWKAEMKKGFPSTNAPSRSHLTSRYQKSVV